MLACLDRGSRTLLAVQAANHFGVNVLGAGQEEVARAFSTKAPIADKWEGIEWSDRDGLPAIAGSIAFVGCELRDVLAGGDHVIVTGEVRRWSRGRRAPGLPRRDLQTPGLSCLDPGGAGGTTPDARREEQVRRLLRSARAAPESPVICGLSLRVRGRLGRDRTTCGQSSGARVPGCRGCRPGHSARRAARIEVAD